MKRIIEYTVSTEYNGKNVLAFLRGHGFSKHILISMKPFPEAVLLNGRRPFMSDLLSEGDVLRLTIPDDDFSEGIVPAHVPFEVIYEDEDILVVNKPAGTPVHPSMGNYENTLANGIVDYYRKKGEDIVFRCINRLDRDTTGLLIIALNPLSASVLSSYLRGRKISRTYLALVHGHVEGEGTIDLPIGRKSDSLIERCIDHEKGERAVTHYRALPLSLRGSSLLELHLETGRTHQIRVHMHAAGHPLLGDSLYYPGDTSGMPRQALHSWKLEFPHPVTGRQMHFAADLPEDIRCRLSF